MKYKNVHIKTLMRSCLGDSVHILQGLSAHVTSLHKISRVNEDLKLAKRHAVKYVRCGFWYNISRLISSWGNDVCLVDQGM